MNLDIDQVSESGEVAIEVGDGVELGRDIPHSQHRASTSASMEATPASAPSPSSSSSKPLEVEPLGSGFHQTAIVGPLSILRQVSRWRNCDRSIPGKFISNVNVVMFEQMSLKNYLLTLVEERSSVRAWEYKDLAGLGKADSQTPETGVENIGEV